MTHARFSSVDMPSWKKDFMDAARRVARAMPTFTSDDIHASMQGWSTNDWCPDSGTVGSLMQALKHERLAQPTDRVIKSTRPASKGRAVRIWTSTVSEAEVLIGKGQMAFL